MNKILELTLCIVLLPLVCLAQVELFVAPTNPVVRVHEPVIFKVAVQNVSSADISGLFILSGAYHGFEIDIVKTDNGRPDRFHNAVMREMMAYDVLFQPVVMKPGERVAVNLCLLYNRRSDKFVFDAPGEYTIQFRLLWDPNKRVTALANVRVTVLGWEADEDKEQTEALRLWSDQHIAAAFQDGAKLSDSTLGRLRKLAEDYPETVYGKLASDLLERAKRP